MFKFKNEVSKPIKERSYVYDLHYHIVWVTKYRNHAFNNDKIVNALKDKLLEIAKRLWLKNLKASQASGCFKHFLMKCINTSGILIFGAPATMLAVWAIQPKQLLKNILKCKKKDRLNDPCSIITEEDFFYQNI